MSDFKPLTPRTIRPDPMIARDLVGYGEAPPDPRWPGGARIAVNFNLNVEGGGEATLVNGDPVSEGMLNDIGVPTKTGIRSPLPWNPCLNTAAAAASGACSTSSANSLFRSACSASPARWSRTPISPRLA
jgi:hypothetical protein